MDYLKSLFQGRINRREYLIFLLIALSIGYLLIPLIFSSTNFFTKTHGISQIFLTILTYVWFLPSTLFLLACNARRWRDLGFSGWFAVVPEFIDFFMPDSLLHFHIFSPQLANAWSIVYGTIVLFLLLMPGQKKTNQYGPRPKPRININALFGISK